MPACRGVSGERRSPHARVLKACKIQGTLAIRGEANQSGSLAWRKMADERFKPQYNIRYLDETIVRSPSFRRTVRLTSSLTRLSSRSANVLPTLRFLMRT